MTRAWLVQHSLLTNQTLWPKMRGPWRKAGSETNWRDTRRAGVWGPRRGFSPAFQGGCELCVARCQLWTRLTSGWRAFPLVLLPADSVGPNSLEMPQAGRPDEGSLCCCRFHLQGGATCVELRPDFPLLLRIIKAHYLFFKCIYFFLNACTCSKFKRYLRFNYETSISFLPQLPSSLSQWLPVLPVSCDIFQEYCLHHKQAQGFIFKYKYYTHSSPCYVLTV